MSEFFKLCAMLNPQISARDALVLFSVPLLSSSILLIVLLAF